MSAWLVTKEHIDVLVTAGIALGVVNPDEDPDAVGGTLWVENADSLRYRYADAAEAWDLPTYATYKFGPAPIEDLAFIHVQNQCYAYQSCEHPGWDHSVAHRFTELLNAAIAKKLHLSVEDVELHSPPGIPWGVNLDEAGKIILHQT